MSSDQIYVENYFTSLKIFVIFSIVVELTRKVGKLIGLWKTSSKFCYFRIFRDNLCQFFVIFWVDSWIVYVINKELHVMFGQFGIYLSLRFGNFIIFLNTNLGCLSKIVLRHSIATTNFHKCSSLTCSLFQKFKYWALFWEILGLFDYKRITENPGLQKINPLLFKKVLYSVP